MNLRLLCKRGYEQSQAKCAFFHHYGNILCAYGDQMDSEIEMLV